MGYVKIPTITQGTVIVNADKVLTVGLNESGSFIDFVLDFTGDGSRIELRFFSPTNAFTNQTLNQWNDAVIAAQNSAVVDIVPLSGQQANRYAYNPAP